MQRSKCSYHALCSIVPAYTYPLGIGLSLFFPLTLGPVHVVHRSFGLNPPSPPPWPHFTPRPEFKNV
ncbi:hypothetical protein COCMIDRAFT_96635 [Bipolaris oryzae ATCC 44560]|uniref:Uncharacterized protein n=1 Tax=Bipolaris oryzae ATCC 44560 TaxID=930090 RepID=W6Z5J2_COCMI|nr:uncharacterized protein COCMIDRAFT_96635 [Bipolaris oryzae ATCC 44560]EUC45038.1 hypothetical protein COCMIDRAFT_96635 [Bipolaris oryzae ATCC 44560]